MSMHSQFILLQVLQGRGAAGAAGPTVEVAEDEAAHASNAVGASLLAEYLADLPGGGRSLANQIEVELLGLRRLVHLARAERQGG